jgi:hypothetical protein
VHLDLLEALAFAGLAAAAAGFGSDVEGEASGLVAADLGFLGGDEDLANVVEDADVGGGVAAGRAADGRLIDLDDAVEGLGPLERPVGARLLAGADELVLGRGEQDVVDERGLAAAADAGDADEAADGTSIFFLPDRYRPVCDSATLQMSVTVPWATMRPPWTPGPGPTSST